MERMRWLMLMAVLTLALAAWGCGSSEEPPAADAPAADAAADAADGPKVDINKATVEELDALKGVSPRIAEAIVKFRDDNGGFTSVEQLNDVKGIGDALFAKLKPLVTCGSEVAPAAAGGSEDAAAGEGDAAAGGSEGAADASGLVNLNSASVEELDAVNGIGMATAKKIVAYREANGPFSSVDQLKDAGVGTSVLNKIRDLVTCGPAGASSGSSASSASSGAAASSGGKVNLNTATLAQIDALPRVSPRVAQAILDARNALPGRKFSSWEQVDAVTGVGESMLTKLQEKCTID